MDGRREVRQALVAGVAAHELFVCESQQDGPDLQAIRQLARDHCSETIVADNAFEKIAFGHRSEGVVLVAATPDLALEQLTLPAHPTVGVLEQVEKPGNLGAIVRSADAAGVAAVLVADGGTDLYNPNAIRASLGAIFSLPCRSASTPHVQQWLRDHRFRLFAARVDGAVTYTQACYQGPTAFVLGSEAAGLSSSWQGADITAVSLPMLGVVDSLNVSVTAAVLFYEALRQRTAAAPEPNR